MVKAIDIPAAVRLVHSLEKLVVYLRDDTRLSGPWYYEYDRDRDQGEKEANLGTANRIEELLEAYSINVMREL